MAKRRRFSRWRRLPPVYRIGEDKPSNPDLEPERLTVYVTAGTLDRAEAQSRRHGFETVQDYCADLVTRAVDAERVRDQVAGIEERRGPLEGLHEIADDPEYLAELSAAATPREHTGPPQASDNGPTGVTVRLERSEPRPEVVEGIEYEPLPPAPHVPTRGLTAIPHPERALAVESAAARVVMRHAGQSADGGEDPRGFLPCLRRGEPVAPGEVGELAQALHDLEREYQGRGAMDRRLSFALHRLAFESQILHTDAWPGSFDAWTVDMLRAVQEAVERILSGQDIRYYPDSSPSPEDPR